VSKVQLNIEEASWVAESVKRTLVVLKKMEEKDSKKTLTLESIQTKIQGIEVFTLDVNSDELSCFEIDLQTRQSKLLRQMAEASAKALTERIIPEYRKRIEAEPEKQAELEPYIVKANARVTSLKKLIEKFGRAE
jgi:predicted RND superfamily exporter protein